MQAAKDIFFPASKALEAMGNTSLRWENHFDLGKVALPEGIEAVKRYGSGRGKQRELSMAAILQGAVALRLIDCGVAIPAAYKIGLEVAFTSNLENEPPRTAPGPMSRGEGRLFERGITWLVIEPARSAEVPPFTICTDADPRFSPPRASSFEGAHKAIAGEPHNPRILVNLTALAASICVALVMWEGAPFGGPQIGGAG